MEKRGYMRVIHGLELRVVPDSNSLRAIRPLANAPFDLKQEFRHRQFVLSIKA